MQEYDGPYVKSSAYSLLPKGLTGNVNEISSELRLSVFEILQISNWPRTSADG